MKIRQGKQRRQRKKGSLEDREHKENHVITSYMKKSKIAQRTQNSKISSDAAF